MLVEIKVRGIDEVLIVNSGPKERSCGKGRRNDEPDLISRGFPRETLRSFISRWENPLFGIRLRA